MGKTVNNPLLTGVSGRIGDLLIKQYKSGTVITMMPSYKKKKKPTERQRAHRDMFRAAVKYAKELRLQHLRQHGVDARTEGQDIYHAGIKKFMLAVQSINKSEVKFESSWAGLSPSEYIAEKIKLALSIVTGEYDQKQEAARAKKTVVKKALGKQVKKKPVRGK